MNFLKKYRVVHFLVMFLFLAIVVGVIIFSQKTKASSSNFSLSQGNCQAGGSVSLNKSSYSPYETIIASANIYISGTSCTASISATNPINNLTKVIIGPTGGSSTGQQNFNATQTGTNYISFLISGSAGIQTLNVYYAINVPTTPSVNVWITSAGSSTPITSVTNGSSVVVHWSSSSNATSCGLIENNTYVSGTSGTFGAVTRVVSPSDGKDFVYKVNCSAGGGTPGTGIVNLKVVPSVNVTGSSPVSPSTISWTSQGATSCKNVNTGATVGTVGSFIASPTVPTAYYIRCYEASQTINGSCSGSYSNTVAGSCSGTVNGSLCNSGGSPWEGDDCELFAQTSCPGSVDPFCFHGCEWNPPSTSSISCSGLSQTSCSSHSGCTWNQGSIIEGDSKEDSTMVVINNSVLSVEADFIDINTGQDITSAPYMSDVNIHWRGVNMIPSSDYECDKENDGTYTDSVIGDYKPLQVSSPVGSTFSHTVVCRKKADHSMNGSDSDSLVVTGNNSPDLTVISISPTSATVPNTVTFSATIKNNGSNSTVASFYNLFQTATSMDDAGSPQGVVDYKITPIMTSINAGGTKTTTKTISLTSDVRFIRACADKSGVPDITGLIIESNENNNCIAWQLLTLLPELTASVPTVTLTNPSARQYKFRSNITNNSTNIGTGASFYNVFQLTDIDPATTNGGGGLVKKIKSTIISFFAENVFAAWSVNILADTPSNPLPALGSGVMIEVSKLYSLPSATQNKIIWVRACSDKNASMAGSITESIETNNCSAWVSFVVGNNAVNGVCGSVHYNCSSGTSINQTNNPTSWNWGCLGANGGSSVNNCSEPKLVMSGVLTPVTTSCVILKGQSSCNINFSWNVINPESVGNSAVTKNPPSINNIVGRGDSKINSALSVKHNSETFFLYNNAVELDQKTVTSYCEAGSEWNGTICSGNPDLIAENITPTFIAKGSLAKLYAVITNQGGQPASSQFSNSFSLSDNSNGNNSTLLGNPSISSLDTNSSQGVSITHTFNTEGNFYLRVCADSNDKNIEESEVNNCTSWTNIEVYDTDIHGVCFPTHYFCRTTPVAVNKQVGTETEPWRWDCPGTGAYANDLTHCTETCFDCGSGTGVCPDPTAVNYPLCTVGNDGKCLNGLSNPPSCSRKAPKYIER